MSTRDVGTWAERVAHVFLEQQGYHILSHNFYTRFGEIDLIAKDGDYLVFVEVKYRKNAKRGYPSQAVNQKKQQRIIKSSQYYMMRYKIGANVPIRFDVVEILGKKIRVIKHAF